MRLSGKLFAIGSLAFGLILFFVTQPRADDAPLQALANRLASASALERAAMRCETARDAKVLYDVFLSDLNVPEEERNAAATRHAHWEQLASQNLVRFGENWVSAGERRESQQAVTDLLEQAWGLITVGDADSAKDRLIEASKRDPEDVRADFTLGLLNSLVARSPQIASRHFRECLKREPDHVAAMNNLAVCFIRQRKYSAAVAQWTSAISVAPASPEIIHNLARLIDLANRRVINVPAGTTKAASTLFANASLFPGSAKPVKGRGWMMMRLYVPGPMRPSVSQKPDGELPRTAGRTRGIVDDEGESVVPPGFVATGMTVGGVVSPGLVAADARFLENADGFAVLSTNGRSLCAARLDTKNLAGGVGLLRCQAFGEEYVAQISARRRGDEGNIAIAVPARSRGTETSPRIDTGSVHSIDLRAGGVIRIVEPKSSFCEGSGVVFDDSGALLGFLLERPRRVDDAYRVFLSFASLETSLRKRSPTNAVPRPAPSVEALKPDEIIRNSTVTVVAYHHSFDVGLASNEKIAEWTKNWVPYEDAWCSVCNGAAKVDCPQVGCAQGGILVKERVEIGRNPITGAIIWTTKSRRVVCPTCGGAGRVRCPYCVNGIDR